MTFETEKQALDFLPQIFSKGTGVVVVQTTHGHWAITAPARLKLPPKTCSICGEPFREFPCNARPINDGQCCAYCDDHVVTPARIRGVF